MSGAPHASAFLLRIRPGQVEEYRRRHAAVWPALTETFRAAGILRYDIWLEPERGLAFGHVLRAAPPDPEAPEPEPVLAWRRHMADVLETDGSRPARVPLDHVFHFEPGG